ncbi:MAG TPA: S8 family serine peptidase [Candidatus Limnocylindrales bacterium]|nr:S8 family serine peptidase [Candidatus Limnocylindrales bacterium]
MKSSFLYGIVALVALPAAVALAAPPQHPVPPASPRVRPELPSTAEVDADRNRIDDRLDHETGELRRSLAQEQNAARREELAARLAEPVRVEVVFDAQVTPQQIDAFDAAGGRIEHLYQAVSYGWSGVVPRAAIDTLPAALGASLRLVAPDLPVQLHLDEATRGGRVRPVWANGFAGSTSGFSGSADTTIAIVDGGVDDSHTDLAGRLEYWKDFTTDAEPTPRDIGHHGSHVAGIAFGTGASFGVGPGTLHYTDSNNLAGIAANNFFISMVHLPPGSVLFQEDATWVGTASALLILASRPNGNTSFFTSQHDATAGPPPVLLDTNLTTDISLAYTAGLEQNQMKKIGRFAIVNTVTNYPAVGDGFNALRGVAPGVRWAGAKVFTNTGASTSAIIAAALDDLVTESAAHNIKVINISIGITGSPGIDVTLRAKVNTVVENGIIVVCSGGNDGPGSAAGNQTDDPGRASLVITVGASNDINELTRYTSSGTAAPAATEDIKPDVLAPGGSDYYSYIMSVDTNDADAQIESFPDRVPNDYYNIKGTSMAAPFVTGSAALVIDAMKQAGTPWTFDPAQPLFVKMMLTASATETNANREVGSGANPTLGRAATPKDVFEGYGLINPDAAIEAISLTWSGDELSSTSAGGRFDRRAWGRKLGITSGPSTTIALAPAQTADYDLYLYSDTPDAKGNPVILASSTNAGPGAAETLTFTPTASETRYLFIKRVSGSGDWSLTSYPEIPVCGDGKLHPNEECEDGNTAAGDCCSPTCTKESNGSPCNDSLFCTATDLCVSGVCTGSGDPCALGGDCNDSCNESANNCSVSAGTACTSDANPCTLDRCNGSGTCAHTAGNAGSICRPSAGDCDVAETCTGSSATCPANSFAASSIVCRAASGVCDAAERCTGSSAACPADSFAATSAVCRAPAGGCDAPETCAGTGGGCPPDLYRSSGTICRDASSVCDVAESCTGSAPSCPSNSFAASTTLCRPSGGVCDVGESCTGASATCPGDTLLSTATVCRTSSGVCDPAETCSGAGASCPADSFLSSAAVCRAAAGACDLAERCTGTSGACPANQVAGSAAICRPAVSVCDVAEHCDGAAVACPADVFETAGVVCRESAGVCDVAEHCAGTSAACASDAMAASGVTCRASAGVCDPAEGCTGTGPACPGNALVAAQVTCRPATNVCDVAEKCTGAAADCPGDAVAGTTVTCRPGAGECDEAEVCDGASKACPQDALRAADTACTGDANPCTGDACDGSSASCQHPAIAAPCDDGLFCNGSESCAAGTCQHSGDPCPGADGDGNCAESCNEGEDACDASDADTSPCDDGNSCTAPDSCTGGLCSGDSIDGCGTTTTTLAAFECGDANEDGVITAPDALKALRTAVGTATCSLALCDFTGDGKVGASDALAILRRAVGEDLEGHCPGATGVTTTLFVTTSTTIGL